MTAKWPDQTMIRARVNEAYQHFFFHYMATPLLVVETSQFGREITDAALDDLIARSTRWAGARGTTYP